MGAWIFLAPTSGTLMEKLSCVVAVMVGVIFIRFSIVGYKQTD